MCIDGFYLDENGSDAIYLDDIVFRDLTASEKEELRRYQYYGYVCTVGFSEFFPDIHLPCNTFRSNPPIPLHRNYQLTSSTGPCFRTEVAACTKYMSRRDWRNYVLGRGGQHSLPDPKKTNAIIRRWIGTYAKEADVTIVILEKMLDDDDKVRTKVSMLLRRWKQIKGLCEQAMANMMDDDATE